MSREIKFRAWDKENESFDSTKGYIFDACYGTMTGIINANINIDRCEIMQYTGLKDSKGFEIYEEDVVKYNEYDEEYEVGVVKYGQGTYDGGCYMYQGWYIENMKGEPIDSSGCYFFGGIEVIGNIYETPNLLNN